ncbi:LLM class flavin-dependent oxidoreductase [Mycolicibacter heraklionensis]|uniref:LLM class flavin-dependent oxidoreductase n=1 Tax=Mycolicibacter heraklionensis TaxID=512402 RepID=A0A9X7WK89_9MYCO|nr:LLM class flavin-dependent oxidoreductase [Mycolicibacter heraklionensis]QZA09806.1 LLM class flavin-dependent oxidoreductase [Mycolicibacter heraklionensis]
MSEPSALLHLAVALDGAGWHPAAWREADARPTELFTAGYWADLVGKAQQGLLHFVTIEDGFTLQSDDKFAADHRVDRVRGRLDAVLIAARVAPRTAGIGLVPTVTTTHSEPFHTSKAIATLDYVSVGRAGVRVQIAGRADATAHFGRREVVPLSTRSLRDPQVRTRIIAHFDETADYVEVLRRLWDSWEDGAEIRDVTTGRFIDRNKLHYIDFKGRWFSVKGPSITPRPPQGQPIVTALDHGADDYRLIARVADVGFVTPHEVTDVATIAKRVTAAREAVNRTDDVLLFADLVVSLDDTPSAAQARQRRLDERAGAEYGSDAKIFTGTPRELADLLQQWHAAGLAGFRLRPAVLPHDLTQITDVLVPELQRRGLFRTEYAKSTLRESLGFERPANRYATV